jgi:hypothetical protein
LGAPALLVYHLVVFIEQQRFWLDLLNTRRGWTDVGSLTATVPTRHRDFSDPPGWPARKAFIYLLNNVDMLQANLKSLEAGKPLDLLMLNNILAEGRLKLIDWGGVPGITRERDAREARDERIETLVADSVISGLNAGTAYVRNLVERSVYYFAQYVDYRYSDPVYPDSSPGRFQVMQCLLSDCGGLFVRTPKTLLYCSDDCARKDAGGGI